MIQLVPSITVMQGKSVRLTQGDFSNETVYDKSPLDVAIQFEEHGIERIYLVDLEGSKKGTPVNYHVLEAIRGYTNLRINYAGGVHTDGDILKLLEFGADSITSATMAVYKPELFSSWIMSYGRNKIALGADSLNGEIRVGGWMKNTKIDLFEHIDSYYQKGLKYLKTTDISRDGVLEGPSFDLYESLVKRFPNLSIFASGGVRNVDDIKHLEDIGIYGVIFGRAYYEGKITMKDIESLVAKKV
jgi:phosphoribosylformimino-5-aminoimidazole carboxamide ribotide isomerase